jgi:phosphatidylserine/phosphatidylglycerophosphate/cardiolipin synthase-like enzyme
MASFTDCPADAAAVARLLPHPVQAATGPAGQAAIRAVLAWFDGTGTRPTMGNTVVPYIYGRCAFADMATAVATATTTEHRIYLLGWGTDPDARMLDGSPPVLLRGLLKGTKAQVRGMFWDNPMTHMAKLAITSGNNVPVRDFINGLPNGAAILDHKLPTPRLAGQPFAIGPSVHHQKLLVVFGPFGLIAFAGGMDINNTRVDVSAGSSEPLHDVQVRVTGDAAVALLRVFEQRWLDHPESAQLDAIRFGMSLAAMTADFRRVERAPRAKDTLPSSTLSGGRTGGTCAVAVGRTYADLRKFNKSAQDVYGFAPQGEETAWKLVENAVKRARRIYIEDQYFVSRRLRVLLVDRLRDPQFRFLLVLMEQSASFEHDQALIDPGGPDPVPNEFPYLIAARNEIRTALGVEDPQRKKWRLFTLRASADKERQKWCGSYVHSKTMIFDDEFATIGSANADDRGYTFDTEIVASITDDPISRLAGQRFARDLRVNLWHKHLGVPHDKLADWDAGLRYWLNPPPLPKAMIVDASDLEDSPMLGPKAILQNFPTADKLWRETIDPDADTLP